MALTAAQSIDLRMANERASNDGSPSLVARAAWRSLGVEASSRQANDGLEPEVADHEFAALESLPQFSFGCQPLQSMELRGVPMCKRRRRRFRPEEKTWCRRDSLRIRHGELRRSD